MEVKILLRQLTRFWQKYIDDDIRHRLVSEISIFYVVLFGVSDLNNNSYRISYAENTC